MFTVLVWSVINTVQICLLMVLDRKSGDCQSHYKPNHVKEDVNVSNSGRDICSET